MKYKNPTAGPVCRAEVEDFEGLELGVDHIRGRCDDAFFTLDIDGELTIKCDQNVRKYDLDYKKGYRVLIEPILDMLDNFEIVDGKFYLKEK